MDRPPGSYHGTFVTNYPYIIGVVPFTFVRHPITWYESLWCHHVRHGWPSASVDELDPAHHINAHVTRDCRSDDFPTFVRLLMDTYPGYYSALVRLTIGPTADLVVGRTEKLASDLVRVLESAGEQFDRDAIHGCPPYAAAPDELRARCIWPDGLADEVCKAERYVIERYYP